MPRRYYDTTGADVSSTAIAFLQGAGANQTMPVWDTFMFQYVDPGANSLIPSTLFMTSAPFPIKVNNLQLFAGPTGVETVNANFLSSRISRSNLDYEVGFKDQTVDLTWFVDDTVQIHSLGWGFKWALLSGYFDEYPWWIHQVIYTDIPSNGGTLLASTLKWRGFIRDVKADRSQVIITLASLMDVFQTTQVPTQVICPGSRLPPYFPAGNASVIGGSLGAHFEVGSTPSDIIFSGGGGSADHALAEAYFTSVNNAPPAWKTAQSGQPFAPVFRIRDNVTVAGKLHVYPYEPINPLTMIGFIPGNDGYINVYFQTAIGLTGAIANGFPYVPPPETGF